ncbi:hypothetical protein K474DRAFT_1669551 [Panus rudis PR-1116 ss-1]|nr:hypothetical protein K474DRAFT_1669725 [Panus rudis PR-1116 ss-1]KAI0070934.1 hypothetical protein K474DRAFT_1669551 [Panus rudis PR-1116 ss-1]
MAKVRIVAIVRHVVMLKAKYVVAHCIQSTSYVDWLEKNELICTLTVCLSAIVKDSSWTS